MKLNHLFASLLCLLGCYVMSAQGTKYIYVSSVENGFELSADGRVYSFVHVPSGTFMMGAENDDDAYAGEYPLHEVSVDGFYICTIEVTQSLWQTVMDKNPSAVKGADLPVNNITWNDCQLFVKRLSKLAGYTFRLPTEAEWEYAAKGGPDSNFYRCSGSDDSDDVAWTNSNSGETIHEVATLRGNELGLYDMSGNAWEWCEDSYSTYPSDPQTNPCVKNDDVWKVIRGGGATFAPRQARCTNRKKAECDVRLIDLGLRLVFDN